MADTADYDYDDMPRAGRPTRRTSLGIYDTPQSGGAGPIELAALGASALWLVICAAALLTVSRADSDFTQVRLLVSGLLVVLPLGMIWVAAITARAARAMRMESQRLQDAIDGLRQIYVMQAQSGAQTDEQASVARKLDEIAQATRKTEIALATFTSRREVRTPEPVDTPPVPAATPYAVEDQPRLALGAQAGDDTPPLPSADFIKALNFPETADDTAGFAALRRAMKDRASSQLIQAAQDTLTLLSQDGIYMDDLVPDRARPEIWRQFAQGARGRAIAALGGIRDRDSLALVAGRMKTDAIFRDTAHHFLRRFDKTFATFEPEASDAEISALSDTRTARAFMLLSRAAGTFD